MADENSEQKLKTAIRGAHSSLAKTFGDAGASKYGSLTYFQKAGLDEAYQKDDVFIDMAKQLSLFAREVRAMRSSYLPIELFKPNVLGADSVLQSALSDDLAQMESYENAFMRMLGMPDSEEIGFAAGGDEDPTGTVVGSVKFVKENGDLDIGSFQDIQDFILDERALRKADRKVRVNNFIFDLDKRTTTTFEDPEDVPLEEAVQDEVNYPKLNEFENNPYAFSYLLFPPVQDSRFSKCINEPDKIVAPPFGNVRARQINSSKIKPSLLESIIRIRIDRLSGQDSQATLKQSSDELVEDDSLISVDVSVGTGERGDTTVPFGESYGILEALFIIRLRSAISGLAKKFSKDRDEIFEAMAKIGLTVTEGDPNEAPTGTGSTPNEGAAKIVDNSEGAAKRTEWDEMMPAVADYFELQKLEDQLLIEDSMMALFGNNSGAIDLQKNTQRNSSVYDAHLMSGLIGIVDVPRGRIRERIAVIQEKRNQKFISHVEPIRASINAILGTDIGIGNLDMLVFSLALFSISETHLINLLSDSAYDRLKTTTLGDVLDTLGSRSPNGRIAAVNEVTDFAYAGYQLFARDIAA